MKNKRFFLVVAVVFLCGFFSVSEAEAQRRVRITEVDDINLGTWAGSSLSGDDPVCVYDQDGDQNYRVRITDNSTITPSNFRLENAARTAEIPFTVYWGETPSPGTTLVTDGNELNASGANTSSQTCGGGDSANFKVDLNNSDLAAVPAGTYSSRLTLRVRKD